MVLKPPASSEALNQYASICAVGWLAFLASVLIPPLGPGRAIGLALRSRFAFKPAPKSLRHTEIQKLKGLLNTKGSRDVYVVAGAMGIGKTCMINTAISKTAGVIKVIALSCIRQEKVVKDTLLELTGIENTLIDPSYSARRVLFWYRLFSLGRRPTVVIQSFERRSRRELTELLSVAETLVDDYKLRVILDGPPNVLDCTGLSQSSVIELKPMTKEMIWRLEQLQDLFKYIEEAGCEDVVFGVLGGNPVHYTHLWFCTKLDLWDGKDPREVIHGYLLDAICDAKRLVCQASGFNGTKLMKLFRETRVFTKSTLVESKLDLPDPGLIFHEVEQDGIVILTPASNAIGLVLRNNLEVRPCIDELTKMVKLQN